MHEQHLRVYGEKSEYHLDGTHVEVFEEGTTSNAAKKRAKEICDRFEAGFLDELISGLRRGDVECDADRISGDTMDCVAGLVSSVTSEVGRALLGLSVMQLCIKAIAQDQSIRLHKGSTNRGAFSWVEGISMRTLDKRYVTPALRRHDLVRLNADGFMMTRTLAENYPYTKLYKARLRGARKEWLTLVEELESGSTCPLESLKYLLSGLLNAASEFEAAAESLLQLCKHVEQDIGDRVAVSGILVSHSEASDYAARLLEVGMHSLVQAVIETGALGPVEVKPLSQMRSANKKHGNIGDVELLENGEIIESWDAKYRKGYLREEIEEAVEKIGDHGHVLRVGFVTTVKIERTQEMRTRIEEIEELYSVEFEVVRFADWVSMMFERCLSSGMATEAAVSKSWLRIYCECLAQRRREWAPIDEPCFEWVTGLAGILDEVAGQ